MNRSPFAARDVDIDPTMSELVGGSMMEEKRHRRKELIQIFRKKRDQNDTFKTTKLINDKNYMDDITASHQSSTVQGETENIMDSRTFE